MKKVFFFASAAILMVSCAPKTTETVEEVTKPTYPNEEVAGGRLLYGSSCGKCHDLPVEKNYTAEQWKKIVPPMAEKAKLDAAQQNKVLQYVLWKTAN